MKCPECGKENDPQARFCAICGCDLVSVQLNWKARVLFFATPTFLLVICMAISWDLGVLNAFETGVEWGLMLAFLFLASGGIFWLITRQFALNCDAISLWQAGIFSVLQLPLTILVSMPIQNFLIENRATEMSFESESNLRLVLFMALYLPFCFAGIGILAWQLSSPNSPTSRFKEFFKRFGIPALLLLSLFLFIGEYFLLPVSQRNLLTARIFTDLGMFRKALDFTNRSLDSQPDNPDALHLKSLLLLSKNDPQETTNAVQLLKKAIEKSPKNPKFHFTLSMALEKAGNNTEAILAVTQAISLKKDQASFWIQLAALQTRVNKRLEAIESYKKALELAPENATIMNNLSYSMLEENRNLPGALDLAREAARREPAAYYTQDTLAWALYKNGYLAEAYDVIRDVKNTASGNMEIDFHHAVIANELGLIIKPRQAFDELLNRPAIQSDRFLLRQVEAALASVSLKESENGKTASSEINISAPDSRMPEATPNGGASKSLHPQNLATSEFEPPIISAAAASGSNTASASGSVNTASDSSDPPAFPEK